MKNYKSRYYEAAPSDDVIKSILELVNIFVPIWRIKELTPAMKLKWADWSIEQHLAASDNVIRKKLKRPPSLLKNWDRKNSVIEKPLFIPLKREHFEAFERGDKDIEYRLPKGRWNERTCHPGRRVTLSLGYGNAKRLAGTIGSFGIHALMPDKFDVFRTCYPGAVNLAACIYIKLDEGMVKR